MLNVVHSEYNGKNYSNIDNINPVPGTLKKSGLPEAVNDPKIFSIRNADMELFDSLSENLQTKIKLSPEWESWKDAPATKKEVPKDSFDDLEDDVPF